MFHAEGKAFLLAQKLNQYASIGGLARACRMRLTRHHACGRGEARETEEVTGLWGPTANGCTPVSPNASRKEVGVTEALTVQPDVPTRTNPTL